MFEDRKPEKEPVGVHKIEMHGVKVSFDGKPLTGKWWRVFPTTCREINAIRLLEHRVDKFAPPVGGGGGILISDYSLMKFITVR